MSSSSDDEDATVPNSPKSMFIKKEVENKDTDSDSPNTNSDSPK